MPLRCAIISAWDCSKKTLERGGLTPLCYQSRSLEATAAPRRRSPKRCYTCRDRSLDEIREDIRINNQPLECLSSLSQCASRCRNQDDLVASAGGAVQSQLR